MFSKLLTKKTLIGVAIALVVAFVSIFVSGLFKTESKPSQD